MNRIKKIKEIAARLTHNKEAKEAYREILSEKFNKCETESTTYKQFEKLFNRADDKVQMLTFDLGELDARMLPTGEVEIY